MKKITAIISVFAIALLAGCLGGEQTPSDNQTINETNPLPVGEMAEITIQNNAFSASAITIARGDAVKWTNLDGRVHQVQILDVTSSPVLLTGNTWIYVFSEAGTYRFRDADLPYMAGTITAR